MRSAGWVYVTGVVLVGIGFAIRQWTAARNRFRPIDAFLVVVYALLWPLWPVLVGVAALARLFSGRRR